MNIEALSTDELKSEYIKFCTAAMIYGTNTEKQRQQIAEEIEQTEMILKIKNTINLKNNFAF